MGGTQLLIKASADCLPSRNARVSIPSAGTGVRSRESFGGRWKHHRRLCDQTHAWDVLATPDEVAIARTPGEVLA
jgi:hypothetical protein